MANNVPAAVVTEFTDHLASYATALTAALDKRFDLAKAYNPDQPRDDHGEWASSSLPPASPEDHDAAVADSKGKTYHDHEANPIETVNIADLQATQSELHGPTLAWYKDRVATGGHTAPVYVTNIDGRMVLTDGHHRVEAMIANGRATIQAHVHSITEKVEKKRTYRPVTLPGPDDAPAVAEGQEELYAMVLSAFRKDAKAVSRQVFKMLLGKPLPQGVPGYVAPPNPEPKATADRFAKASQDSQTMANNVAKTVTFTNLNALPLVTTAVYKGVALKASSNTIAVIGPDSPNELFETADDAAQDWAELRAAEMVGMKWVDGELVENPNAAWAITDGTRDYLRAYLADSFDEGKSLSEIADGIENMPQDQGLDAFSAGRAMMIAHTESAMAHGQGQLDGMQAVADNGVHILKQWVIGEGACDVCNDNADDGPIELDDQWDNDGNPVDTVPSHPHCRCAIQPVVGQDDESDTSGDDATDTGDDDIEAVIKAYNPDQERDEHGRWTSGGPADTRPLRTPEEQKEATDDLAKYANDLAAFYKTQYPDGKSPAAFLAEHGQAYTYDAKSFEGPRGKAGMCYMNAGREALDGRMQYVEGQVSVHGAPVNHAWLTDGNNHVIDPTLKPGGRIEGYYGVPIDHTYLRDTILRTRVWGVLGPQYNPDLYTPEADWSKVVAKTEKLHKYSPDQPRDDRGRWSDEGGNASAPNAMQLLAQYRTGHSPEEFMRNLPDAQKQALQQAAVKLMEGTPTDALVSEGGFKNPDGTYTDDRAMVHQAIIEKILSPEAIARATPPEGQQPTFDYIGGRAGSGKGYFTSEPGPVDASHSLYLNNDDIKDMLPGYAGWNAMLVHEESSDVFNQISGMARGMGLNVIEDSTMRTYGSAEKRIADYRGAGYKVNGYYMFTAPETAATRAIGRFMSRGRYVAPEYVLSSTSNEKTFDAVKPDLDKWMLYDNSGSSPVLVDQGGK